MVAWAALLSAEERILRHLVAVDLPLARRRQVFAHEWSTVTRNSPFLFLFVPVRNFVEGEVFRTQ